MVSHMKTTLTVDNTVMAQLKREAARQGRTTSELGPKGTVRFTKASKSYTVMSSG